MLKYLVRGRGPCRLQIRLRLLERSIALFTLRWNSARVVGGRMVADLLPGCCGLCMGGWAEERESQVCLRSSRAKSH